MQLRAETPDLHGNAEWKSTQTLHTRAAAKHTKNNSLELQKAYLCTHASSVNVLADRGFQLFTQRSLKLAAYSNLHLDSLLVTWRELYVNTLTISTIQKWMDGNGYALDILSSSISWPRIGKGSSHIHKYASTVAAHLWAATSGSRVLLTQGEAGATSVLALHRDE